MYKLLSCRQNKSPADYSAGLYIKSGNVCLLLFYSASLACITSRKSGRKQVAFLDAFLLDASLCLRGKTLPQGRGEPIWHKNKKVSENSET
ncbi:MAG: hypothetical protein J6P90_00245 [Rikenellaceae bacterium]|nr:hypothetical protein [Rikenellaceae bacterium]